MNGQPRFNGPLPLQQTVSSASQLPSTPSRSSFSPSRKSFSSHVASHQYVEQYRALIEHQRQVFDEERNLWQTERTELHEKVLELETAIRVYRQKLGDEVSSPRDIPNFSLDTSMRSERNERSKNSSGSVGDEFWRGAGGKSDAQPTRTFSESSSRTRVEERKLPSIAENDGAFGSTATFESVDKPETKHKSRIEGAKINQSLDGINFKPSGLPPSVVQSIMTPQSPSPLRSPSPSRASGSHIDLPTNKLLGLDDPYTRHAGHTPLARQSDQLNGLSAHSSDSATPAPPEKERPPLEPRPSSMKQPSERAASYFPPPLEDQDGDLELKGPLTLNNLKNDEDKGFLKELDTKLVQAARSKTYEPSEVSPTDKTLNGNPPDVDKKGKGADPDSEPRLRIKRSMNFGSQLGALSCGRGI
ncbi:hypothetical protein MMC06_000947 [Schaereria dolodes]|nr:hypothetical protein [Schaereria dolodes]